MYKGGRAIARPNKMWWWEQKGEYCVTILQDQAAELRTLPILLDEGHDDDESPANSDDWNCTAVRRVVLCYGCCAAG